MLSAVAFLCLSVVVVDSQGQQQQQFQQQQPGFGSFFSNLGSSLTNFFRRPVRPPGQGPVGPGGFQQQQPQAPTPPPVFFNVPAADFQPANIIQPVFQQPQPSFQQQLQPSFQSGDQQGDQSQNQPFIQSSQQQQQQQQPQIQINPPSPQYQYVYVTETVTVTKPSVCTTYRQQGDNIVVGG